MTARDGSPVELYARMPTFGEAELVQDAISAGAEILERDRPRGMEPAYPLLPVRHTVPGQQHEEEGFA